MRGGEREGVAARLVQRHDVARLEARQRHCGDHDVASKVERPGDVLSHYSHGAALALALAPLAAALRRVRGDREGAAHVRRVACAQEEVGSGVDHGDLTTWLGSVVRVRVRVRVRVKVRVKVRVPRVSLVGHLLPVHD